MELRQGAAAGSCERGRAAGVGGCVWGEQVCGLMRLAALGAVVKLSSRSPSRNRAAADLAPDRALHGVKVHVATHIPGVANTVAVALSRFSALERNRVPSGASRRQADCSPCTG